MRLPEYEKDGKWYIDNDLAIPMLRKAYEYGVNYFDTAYYYCHSNSERTLGKPSNLSGIKYIFPPKSL